MNKMYQIIYLEEAKENIVKLKKQGDLNKLKKVKQAIDKLSANPRHPGLHTHKNKSFSGSNGEEIFQSYVENRTPGAFRIFWTYGPNKEEITILAITPHP